MVSSDAETAAGEPAGLYVHVPFCTRVCPYCDFAVLTDAPGRRQRFLQALVKEIEGASFPDVPFDTIYLGGGTPSVLHDEEIVAILDALSRRFRLDAPWITLEANPEDVTPEAAQRWRALGVRTLSLGVQSFDDAELRFLGRAHDGIAAAAAVVTALEAGFDVVSVDLIYGLPDQTPEASERNLECLLGLQPQHASCYQLTIHDGTRFGKQARQGTLTELPSEAQADLFLQIHERFADAGWDGYEVSNFARQRQHQSRHNRKYWRHVPYLGMGPAAHSYDGGHQRWWNHRSMASWAGAIERGEPATESREQLTDAQWILEAILFGLRTSTGIDTRALRDRTGVDLTEANRAVLGPLVDGELLVIDGEHWRPTRRGMAVAEWLALQIEVPEPS